MADFFRRLKQNAPLDTEEMRRDMAIPTPDGTSYLGLAEAGADPASEIWAIIKIAHDNSGNPCREQLFLNVAWDDRQDL